MAAACLYLGAEKVEDLENLWNSYLLETGNAAAQPPP